MVVLVKDLLQGVANEHKNMKNLISSCILEFFHVTTEFPVD